MGRDDRRPAHKAKRRNTFNLATNEKEQGNDQDLGQYLVGSCKGVTFKDGEIRWVNQVMDD